MKNWRLIMPFKGSYCWEMQLGPLVIQWSPQSQHPPRSFIWCWLDRGY